MCGINPNFYAGAEWLFEPIRQSTPEGKQKFTQIIQGFSNALLLNTDLFETNKKTLHQVIDDALIKQKEFEENILKQEDFLKDSSAQFEAITARTAEQQAEDKSIFNHLVNTAKTQIDEIKEHAESAIEALKNEIRLHEPIKYWEDEFKRFQTSSWLWGGSFIFVAIIAITFLILMTLFLIHKQFLDLNNPNIESVIIFLIMPLFFFIWILKLLAKRYQTNFYLMNDAKNRAVMTQAFLALMSGGHADNNDRILILNSLFRPTPDVKYDDGAPIHWFDLIVERIKDNKGKND